MACAAICSSPGGCGAYPSESALRRRRIDFRDSAEALFLGGVRAGDERAADLGAVPARFDAETKRLFGFDMARREILHGGCFQVGARPLIERRVRVVRGKTILVQLSSE